MRGAGVLLMATVIGLAGACNPLPYENPDSLPAVVSPPDGSPERLAMNARVYDAVVRTVELTFYDGTFNGVDFRAEAAVRRANAVAQPDEAKFYEALNGTLNLLEDGHTRAVRPTVIYRRAPCAVRRAPSVRAPCPARRPFVHLTPPCAVRRAPSVRP